MKLFSSLQAVILLFLITGYASNLTKGQAETEPSLNNIEKYALEENTLSKRASFSNRVACGLRKVHIDYTSREPNRTSDNGDDNSYDGVDDAEHLDKIIGGNYVAYGEVPWQVNILYNNKPICSGAIISEYWVITAASCVFSRITPMYTVAAGDHRLYYNDPVQRNYQVAWIERHESYQTLNVWEYNIALVKIKKGSNGRGIQFNDYVQPVCLPLYGEIPMARFRLKVTGWGHTSGGGRHSMILKKTIMPVTEQYICHFIFPTVVTEDVFCAGYLNGSTDMCYYDEGGPATNVEGRINILYGITSVGDVCKPRSVPSIFSNVGEYQVWIKRAIRRLSVGLEGNMPARFSEPVTYVYT